MKVLIACERSGVVRQAFADAGHIAWSVDLAPAVDAPRSPLATLGNPTPRSGHYQGDIMDCEHYLGAFSDWDLLIAHPPCTYLSSSGLHWNKRVPGREEKTEQALAFIRWLMALPVPCICIENPVGCISTRIDAREYGFSTRKATQYVQPYEFGNDASKRTGLWLKGLPPLAVDPAQYIKPRIVDGKPRWANQTDSGQNRLGPSDDRAQIRSTTYPGIAQAMAEQWGQTER